MDQDSCVGSCAEYPCVWKVDVDDPIYWGDLCNSKYKIDIKEISKNKAPANYRISWEGIQRKVETKDSNGDVELITWPSVTRTPTWIDKLYLSTDDKVYVTINFIDHNGKINEKTVEQKDILTKKGILDLTSYGINSTDATAKYLTEYFSLALSEKKFEIGKIYTKMGWHDNNNTFVLGNQIIRKNSESKSIFVDSVQDEIVSAYVQKGTPVEWYNSLSGLLDYDNVRFSVYTACTPPLLRIINSKSFVKEDTGTSSIGKTTSALVGMSIWGNPEKLILSTDTTAYAMEENCTIKNDLPILLDDITLMQKDTLNRIVYMVANEGGKNRGKKDGGLREVNRWKSVVMTTGELYITGSKSTGGAEVRIVSTEGGIGKFDPDTVTQFELKMLENYGVIGPLIIKKILSNKSILIEEYKQNMIDFEEKVSEIRDPDGIIKRLIKTYAAIAVAGEVFEDVMSDLNLIQKDPLSIVADKLGEKIHNTTDKMSERAFDAILDWHQTEARCFCQDGNGEAGDRYQLFGNSHSELNGDGLYEYLDIIPTELEKYLDKHFERKDILKSFIKSWEDDGKLIPYTEKKTGKQTSTSIVTLKSGLKTKRAYRFLISHHPKQTEAL